MANVTDTQKSEARAELDNIDWNSVRQNATLKFTRYEANVKFGYSGRG